jgi:CDGSH-type Zn-finger protein/uncharacterized Fe-S cluster protein YjdI
MTRKIREYEGEGITIRFEPRRCIHAKECVRGLESVFDPNRRPWVDPVGADADAIARTVSRCPTGALQFERSDGGPAEQAPGRNSVRIVTDGPLYVRGELEIRLPGEDKPRNETRVALCRCGESKNKPFCDDSHYECGFKDPGELEPGPDTVEAELAEAEPESGPLRITPRANGSLFFEGPTEITSADGTVRVATTRRSLCRCGHSLNKPFCDGAHRDAGFEAE